MEIKIDFSNKRIEVLSQIEMGELVKNLKKMFPKNWKEFTIIQSCDSYPIYYGPYYPWWHQNYPIVHSLCVQTQDYATIGTTYTTAGIEDSEFRISAN